MKQQSFQEFIELYGPNGSDDNGPEMMGDWLSELTIEEILEYAEMAYREGISPDDIFKINF